MSRDEAVWKALADGTRRAILDALAGGPLTTGEVCARFRPLCRTNVMKHMGVLETAGLLLARREGRRRLNYLNPVPIQRIHERWVSRHVSGVAAALSRFRDHVEAGHVAAAPRRQRRKTKGATR